MMEVYSYKSAFGEGSFSLHLGFRVEGVLFALTSVQPQLTPYVEVPKHALSGPHIRSKKQSYVTVAYNQQAKRYNNIPAGKIDLEAIPGWPELYSFTV
jgi:hypothetical protein